MRTFQRAAWICAALMAAGCDDGGDDGGDTPDSGTAGSIAVASYNAGLARGFVDYADERKDQVMAGIAASGIDVLCGQEFWEDGDINDLKAAVQAELPHQFNIPPDAGDPGECAACIPGETDALEACVRAECDGVDDSMLISCATMSCNEEVNGLSGGCVSCAATQVNSSIDDILAACTGDAETGCYAYEGAFGTTINSRYAIAESDSKVFASSLNRRAVIYAKLSDTPVGEVHVFCTHLSAIFSSIPYPKDTGSWEEEQRTQIDEMRAFVDEKAGAGQIILMGDFNTGPAIPNVSQAEAPENYAALSAGYSVPYVEQSPTCTFCAENPLVTGIDRSESEVIDHVLLKGFASAETLSERFLDGTITVTTANGDIETAYSDHYGIRVTITQ